VDQLPFEPGDTVLDLPPRLLELQRDQPCARVRTPTGDPAWLVTRHEDVKTLLTDARLSRSRPESAGAIPDGAAFFGAVYGSRRQSADNEVDHRWKLRALLAPAFAPRRMEAVRGSIAALVDTLLDTIEAAADSPEAGLYSADLHAALAVPLPARAICALLGVPGDDWGQVAAWSEALAGIGGGERGADALRDLTEHVRALIPGKRAAPADDLLCDLATVRAGGPLPDAEIARVVALLLFAGHSTTSARIDLGVLLLLREPEWLDRLRADADSAGRFVNEVLRLSGTGGVGGVPRYARADIELHDARICAGEAVLLGIGAANRDPSAFREPHALDPAREPNPHLAFGHGASYCLGAALARIELEEAFARLAARYPRLHLAEPYESLRARRDLITGGLERLLVAW
jgi:pentalenolactone synthase